MSTKNSGWCWRSSPPCNSASRSREPLAAGARPRRPPPESRSARLYIDLAKRSNASGAGVSASCTNAGEPHADIVVRRRFTRGWRSRSKRSCEKTLVMKWACFFSRMSASGTSGATGQVATLQFR